MISPKPIELFCGTGGVGKTTLASSRAIYLASIGRKVLLITLDPSKRLKEVLNLDENKAGEIETVNSDIFSPYLNSKNKFQFNAMLMNPEATISRIGRSGDKKKGEGLDNSIIKILSRPNGGMNEIMAMVEITEQLESGKFETIILDTPPGKHFIDFLESSNKINQFFDKSFIDMFNYLGKTIGGEKTKLVSKKIISMVISKGIKRLLRYLDRVTGSMFVDQFLDAISVLYANKDSFLKALNLEEKLKIREFSNWILVTSVDHQKLSEASFLKLRAGKFMHQDNYLAINKSMEAHIKGWEPIKPFESALRDSMITRERNIKKFSRNYFSNILEFGEVLGSSPAQHVSDLCISWKNFEK
jgi:anion-transporting  ArsA/GET3 family ATPase